MTANVQAIRSILFLSIALLIELLLDSADSNLPFNPAINHELLRYYFFVVALLCRPVLKLNELTITVVVVML